MPKHKFYNQVSYDDKGNRQYLRVNGKKSIRQIREQAERIMEKKGMATGPLGLFRDPQNNQERKLMTAASSTEWGTKFWEPIRGQVGKYNKETIGENWGTSRPIDTGTLVRAKASGGKG